LRSLKKLESHIGDIKLTTSRSELTTLKLHICFIGEGDLDVECWKNIRSIRCCKKYKYYKDSCVIARLGMRKMHIHDLTYSCDDFISNNVTCDHLSYLYNEIPRIKIKSSHISQHNAKTISLYGINLFNLDFITENVYSLRLVDCCVNRKYLSKVHIDELMSIHIQELCISVANFDMDDILKLCSRSWVKLQILKSNDIMWLSVGASVKCRDLVLPFQLHSKIYDEGYFNFQRESRELYDDELRGYILERVGVRDLCNVIMNYYIE
jgi:hypothetical protein